MSIRHFVITRDSIVREFSSEHAARVASGSDRLPEFAGDRVRYLQVNVDDADGQSLTVKTAGAALVFDEQGRIMQAAPPEERELLNQFEHETCVQWVLKDLPHAPVTFH